MNSLVSKIKEIKSETECLNIMKECKNIEIYTFQFKEIWSLYEPVSLYKFSSEYLEFMANFKDAGPTQFMSLILGTVDSV